MDRITTCFDRFHNEDIGEQITKREEEGHPSIFDKRMRWQQASLTYSRCGDISTSKHLKIVNGMDLIN